MNNIAIFCGASAGNQEAYTTAAKQLASELAASNIGIVYGGTSVGLMGVLADEALSCGGNVIGIIPEHLVDVEIAHRGITTLHVVSSMSERKTMMMALADGFILLPGGTGSLDEIFEVITLFYLKQHQKPIGILNINGYYDSLIQFMQHAVNEGFLKHHVLNAIYIESEVEKLLRHFRLPAISDSALAENPVF